MIDEKPRVIIIPAKPELAQEAVIKRRLRVVICSLYERQ